MSDADYYIQKAEEMRALAMTARDPKTRREFERLAEEYRALAESAQPTRA